MFVPIGKKQMYRSDKRKMKVEEKKEEVDEQTQDYRTYLGGNPDELKE